MTSIKNRILFPSSLTTSDWVKTLLSFEESKDLPHSSRIPAAWHSADVLYTFNVRLVTCGMLSETSPEDDMGKTVYLNEGWIKKGLKPNSEILSPVIFTFRLLEMIKHICHAWHYIFKKYQHQATVPDEIRFEDLTLWISLSRGRHYLFQQKWPYSNSNNLSALVLVFRDSRFLCVFFTAVFFRARLSPLTFAQRESCLIGLRVWDGICGMDKAHKSRKKSINTCPMKYTRGQCQYSRALAEFRDTIEEIDKHAVGLSRFMAKCYGYERNKMAILIAWWPQKIYRLISITFSVVSLL